jgi:hypothetical protein
MTKKKPETNTAKPKYEPTSRELTAIKKLVAQSAAKAAPRLEVLNEKGTTISPAHPDQLAGQALLMDALGTADVDFYGGLIHQLANAAGLKGEVDERSLNFMLSVVKGIEPKDQVEALLAAQMAAVHMATMTFARRLAHVEDIPQQDSAERAFNKLTRTFATQMEALKRYRTGGEQKVTVQHVSVSEGGQAIVGNVTQAPREAARGKAGSSPPALPNAQQSPMPILGERASSPVPLKRKSAE